MHVDDFDISNNEKEMAKKVKKLDGRNKRKSGATSHAPKSSLVAPNPSPFFQNYFVPPLVCTPYALNMFPQQLQVVPHLQEKKFYLVG